MQSSLPDVYRTGGPGRGESGEKLSAGPGARLDKERLARDVEDMKLSRKNKHEIDQILMETWLNDVSLDLRGGERGGPGGAAGSAVTHEVLKQARVAMRGLTATGLSREELMRGGMSGDEVNRLYQGIYVHSIGFHHLLQDMLKHCSNKTRLLKVVWQTFVGICEKALRVQFASDFLTLLEDRERFEADRDRLAGRVDTLETDVVSLERTLAEVTAKHSTESSTRKKLEEKIGSLVKSLEEERRGKSHALQKYVREVEHRSELQDAAASAHNEAQARDEACSKAKERMKEAVLEENLAKAKVMGLKEQLAELQKQFETVCQDRESLNARLRVQEDRCKALGDERHKVHEAYQEQVRSKLLLQGNVESKMETIKKLEARADQENLLRLEAIRRAEETEDKSSSLQHEHIELKMEMRRLGEKSKDTLAQLESTKDELMEETKLGEKFCMEIDYLKEEAQMLKTDISSMKGALEREREAKEKANLIRVGLQSALSDCKKSLWANSVGLATLAKSYFSCEAARMNLSAKNRDMSILQAQTSKTLRKTQTELEALTTDHSEVRQRLQTCETLLRAASQDLTGLRTSHSKLKRAHEEKVKDLECTQQRLEETEATLGEARDELERKSDVLNSITEKLGNLEESRNTLMSQLGTEKNAKSEQEKTLNALQTNHVYLTEGLTNIKTEMEETKKDLEETRTQLANAEETNVSLSAELKLREEENSVLKAEKSRLTTDLGAATSRGDELDDVRQNLEKVSAEQAAELDTRRENIDNLEVELSIEKDHRKMEQDSYQAKYAELSRNITKEKQNHEGTALELHNVTSARDMLQEKHDDLNQQYNALTSEKEQLEALLKQDRSVRNFLQSEIETLKTQVDNLKKDMQNESLSKFEVQDELDKVKHKHEAEIVKILEEENQKRLVSLEQLDEERADRKAELELKRLEWQEELAVVKQELEQEMLAREKLGQETLELERIAMENSSGQTQEKFEILQSQLREVSRERDSLAAENQRLSGSVGRNHARGRRRRMSVMSSWSQSETPDHIGQAAPGAEIDPLHLARTIIWDITVKKIRADLETDSPKSLESFTYEYFLFHFGLRAVAEAKLKMFASLVQENRHSQPMFGLFGRLCGITDDALPGSAVVFYFQVLATLLKELDWEPLKSESLTCNVSVAIATALVKDKIKGLRQMQVNQTVADLSEKASDGYIGLEDFMERVLGLWVTATTDFESQLKDILVKSKGRPALTLSFSEFHELIDQLYPDLTFNAKSAQMMFREMLRLGGAAGRMDASILNTVMLTEGHSPITVDMGVFLLDLIPEYEPFMLLEDSWRDNLPTFERIRDLDDEEANIFMHACETPFQGLQTLIQHKKRQPEAWKLFRKIMSLQWQAMRVLQEV